MASQEQEIRYPDYPLFKGLQKPLEFMGIQGRYIYWAAGAIGGAIVGFILAYCLIGFIAGLIALVASISIGAALIIITSGYANGWATKTGTISLSTKSRMNMKPHL